MIIYQPGEAVKVSSTKTEWITGHMQDYMGKEMIILATNDDDDEMPFYVLEDDPYHFLWTNEELEAIEGYQYGLDTTAAENARKEAQNALFASLF